MVVAPLEGVVVDVEEEPGITAQAAASSLGSDPLPNEGGSIHALQRVGSRPGSAAPSSVEGDGPPAPRPLAGSRPARAQVAARMGFTHLRDGFWCWVAWLCCRCHRGWYRRANPFWTRSWHTLWMPTATYAAVRDIVAMGGVLVGVVMLVLYIRVEFKK